MRKLFTGGEIMASTIWGQRGPEQKQIERGNVVLMDKRRKEKGREGKRREAGVVRWVESDDGR